MFIGHFALGFAGKKLAPKTGSANLMWLFVLFAYWFDRHRTPTVSAETA